MLPHELPQNEYLNLCFIGEACFALYKQLSDHNFKIIKFRLIVSPDRAVVNPVIPIFDIEIEIVVDDTLPVGTINVAALVQ